VNRAAFEQVLPYLFVVGEQRGNSTGMQHQDPVCGRPAIGGAATKFPLAGVQWTAMRPLLFLLNYADTRTLFRQAASEADASLFELPLN